MKKSERKKAKKWGKIVEDNDEKKREKNLRGKGKK